MDAIDAITEIVPEREGGRFARPPFSTLLSLPGRTCPPGARSGLLSVERRGLRARFGPREIQLRWAVWRPALATRGTVCVFHGRTEFIEKYYEVVEDLLVRGFTVATLDWRGQGGSSRLRGGAGGGGHGHVTSFSEYIDDLSAFMRQVVYPHCPAPHFALSHSMSGPVMLLAAARRRPFWFERVVLSAPMLRLPLPVLGPRGLRGLAGSMSSAGLGGMPVGRARHDEPEAAFAGNALTSDRRRFLTARAMTDAAPALAVGPPTVGWLSAAARAMDQCFDLRLPRRVQVPVLFVGAACDTVVSTRATEELARRMRSASYVMIPNAKHEILMERDALRDQFWSAFEAFVPGDPTGL